MDAAALVPRPTAEHYRLLRRLRRLVLRSDDASLIFLGGDDRRSLDWLRSGLDGALRARSRRVLHWQLPDAGPDALPPEAAATALGPVLTALLAPAPGNAGFAVWVDLHGPARQQALRDRLFARLNERRAQLLRPKRAVIIAGPLALEARAGDIAPDLWSVRTARFEVPPWPADVADVRSNEPAAAAALPVAARPVYLPLWHQAWRTYQARQADGEGDAAVDPWLGWSAVGEALAAGRFDESRMVLDQTRQVVAVLTPADDAPPASRLAWSQAVWEGDAFAAQRRWREAQDRHMQALAISERLVVLTGESHEALRDWSVSLHKVGDVQRALGDLDAARERYEQALAISERLVALTGESPESLRDWSVSLNQVGDVQRALGDLNAARERYEQGLAVSEQLVALTGESPESLRDWSVSLDKVGDVQRGLGDVNAAHERYEQGLAISERLVELTGESPESLRDWWVSLTRVGDVKRALGDLNAAHERYEQGLAISERLVALTGESPESLRDWSVSLNMVGDVQRALGDLNAAHERYKQGLEIRERLVALTGESPESLRDWSISLDKVGDVQRALGDLDAARERYERSLEIRERLVAVTGESPESLRDWWVSLTKVGDVQRALGDLDAAGERYEQSLAISERLVALTGDSPEALRDLALSWQYLGLLAEDAGDRHEARRCFEHDQAAAEAALRQSPHDSLTREVLDFARSRLAVPQTPPE